MPRRQCTYHLQTKGLTVASGTRKADGPPDNATAINSAWFRGRQHISYHRLHQQYHLNHGEAMDIIWPPWMRERSCGEEKLYYQLISDTALIEELLQAAWSHCTGSMETPQ